MGCDLGLCPSIHNRDILKLLDQENSTYLSDKEVPAPRCSLNSPCPPHYHEMNLVIILKLFRFLGGVGEVNVHLQKYKDNTVQPLLREVVEDLKEEMVDSPVEGVWKEREMGDTDEEGIAA